MYEIHTQETPNPNALKFNLATESFFDYNLEFTRENYPKDNPFIVELFSFKEITRVYWVGNFITVNKTINGDWFEVAGFVRKTIIYHLTPNIVAVLLQSVEENPDYKQYIITHPNSGSAFLNEWFSSKILPATEQDGGGMFIRDYKDDILILQRVGACVDCPYVDQTLELGVLKPLQNQNFAFTKIQWKNS